MNVDILLWGSSDNGPAEKTDPGCIGTESNHWKQDIQNYGPWQSIDTHPLTENKDGLAWRSSQCIGDQAVIICGSCTSSMDVAWYLIEKGVLKAGDSVLAVKQAQGRGQHQRNWISPAGNIYAAWVLPELEDSVNRDPKWQGLIPLIVGYTIVNTLKECGISAQMKWPNDLLVNDRKFGGILVENRLHHQVVGVGLNISYSPDDKLLRNDFAVPATNLDREGVDATPLELWIRLVDMGNKFYKRLHGTVTPEEFIIMAKSCMAWMGRNVRVKSSQGVFTSTITGLADDGGLLLKCENEETILYSGSVIPSDEIKQSD